MPGKVVSAIWGRRELSCGLALTCLDLSSPSHLLCRASHLRPDPCRRSPISPFTEESAGPGPGPGELRRPCAPLSKSGPAASLLLGAGRHAPRDAGRPRLLLSWSQVLDSSSCGETGLPEAALGSPSLLPS